MRQTIKIDNLYDLNKAIQENTESINLKIDREGTILEYNIVPKQIAEQQGERWYLGVNLKEQRTRLVIDV